MMPLNMTRKRIVPPNASGIVGGNTLEEVARKIQLQKAQDAANPPDPYSEEELRKQMEALGKDPEVGYAPDAKFDASADPSGIPPAALGIALQTYMKNKQAKQEQAAKEYDKKMARIEKQADAIFAAKFKQYLDNNDPDKKADREWEQKQRGWQEEDRNYTLEQRALKPKMMSAGGGGYSGGGQKSIVPPMTEQPGTLTKEEQKYYDDREKEIRGRLTYDTSTPEELTKEYNKVKSSYRQIDPKYDAILKKISPSEPAPASKREKVLQFVSNANATSPVNGAPPSPAPTTPATPQTPSPSFSDVGKEVVNKGASVVNNVVGAGKRIIPNALTRAGNAVTTNALSEPMGMVRSIFDPYYPYATKEDWENAMRVQELLKKRGR